MENDPRAYLETEVRIIAENETHVVIAQRVEKAYLARNILFLAALADKAGPGVRKLVHSE